MRDDLSNENCNRNRGIGLRVGVPVRGNTSTQPRSFAARRRSVALEPPVVRRRRFSAVSADRARHGRSAAARHTRRNNHNAHRPITV